MLTRQQRGRHHHRHLYPFIAAMKAARSATSVLPKPTSPQTSRSIGFSRRQIVTHPLDRSHLVFGLVIGEAGRKLVVKAFRAPQCRRGRMCRSAAMRIRPSAMSSRRFFSRALRACQATAAEPVELHFGAVRAVAGEKLDVFDRQEQLGIAGIVQFEAGMRRARRLDRAQADELADAVLGMHHITALVEPGDFRDVIGAAALALGAAHQPVTQHVLLADDDQIIDLETAFYGQNGGCGLAGLSAFEIGVTV
jgi:hypothetical protein